MHDVSVRLEMCVGRAYDCREEGIEQEEAEHEPLAKALFHSEPPRAHPVVEPRAYSHAIVELTNGHKRFLWHDKTGEYRLEGGSVNGGERYDKV